MSDFPAIDENQLQPMDAKRSGERFTESQLSEKVLKGGHTTVVESPSYGIVRARGYLDQPVD